MSLFALGFRPFFLAAGLSAAILIPVWLAGWYAQFPLGAYYESITWHAHEMLYGYATAVIAGFLLTAVRNWTGRDTAHGQALAVLGGVWLLARVLPLLPRPQLAPVLALVDLSFLPALMIAIGIPLVKHGKWQNTVLLAIPGLMFVGNSLVHWGIRSGDAQLAQSGLEVGLYAAILLIVIIGGRVIPFFTRGAIAGAHSIVRPPLEGLAIGSYLCGAAALILHAPPGPTAMVLAAATAIHAVRLGGWYDRRIWGAPLLWVLFLAYAWLVVGLAISAAAQIGLCPPSLATHAFTVGTLSVMTFGMMARVALGHTGRPLHAARLTVVSVYLVILAAICRVFGPLLLPTWNVAFILLSGFLFTGAALSFLWVYLPILISPRADGKPG